MISTVVATRDGAAVIWLQPASDARHETVMAQLLDRDGRAAGPARQLRVTTGPVASLAADALDGALWIAWIAAPVNASADAGPSTPGDDGDPPGEHLVVAMRASADLATVDPPRTVEDFRHRTAERPWPGTHVEVAALPDGSSAVLYTGADATCLHEGPPDGPAERIACVRYDLAFVDAAGHVRRALDRPELTPAELPHGLVRLPDRVAFLMGEDHISYKTLVETVPLAPGASGAGGIQGEALMGYLWSELAFTGDRLVFSLGVTMDLPGGDSPEGQRAALVERLDGSPDTPSRMVDDQVLFPALGTPRVQCTRDRLTVRLAWTGGAVELDPGRPGASFRLETFVPRDALGPNAPPGPMAWAGRALVALDEQNAPVRYVCNARGRLVRAAP